MNLLIKNGRVITDSVVLENRNVLITDGIIMGIYPYNNIPDIKYDMLIDALGQYISPGFIDMHVHGGENADFSDDESAGYNYAGENIITAAKAHLKYGTTTIVPTICGNSFETMLKNLKDFNLVKQKQLKGELADLPYLLGVHIEGPYFSFEQRGAQDEKFLRNPEFAEYSKLIDETPYIVKWSLACELPGSKEFAIYLKKHNIKASVGHSSATFEEVMKMLEYGFDSVTHLYSGCSTVKRIGPYRHAGIVEAAFYSDDITAEVIADGVHLPESLLKLIYKIKGPDKICLITDSIRAGAAEGITKSYIGKRSDGRVIYIENDVAVMPDRLSFAGSIATTDRLVRTMHTIASVDIVNAVKMATLTPAKYLGIDNCKGSISVGKDADIVIFDDDIKVSKVIVKGKIVE